MNKKCTSGRNGPKKKPLEGMNIKYTSGRNEPIKNITKNWIKSANQGGINQKKPHEGMDTKHKLGRNEQEH